MRRLAPLLAIVACFVQMSCSEATQSAWIWPVAPITSPTIESVAHGAEIVAIGYRVIPDEPELAPDSPEWDAALDRVSEIVRSGRFAFEVDWSAGEDAKMPHVAASRHLSRALCSRAKNRVAAGEFAGAARNLNDALAIADRVSEDPIVISSLVALSNIAFVLDAIESFDAGARSDVVRACRPKLVAMSTGPDPFRVKRAMRGEAALTAWVLEHGYSSVRADPGEPSRRSAPERVLAFNELVDRFMEQWTSDRSEAELRSWIRSNTTDFAFVMAWNGCVVARTERDKCLARIRALGLE